MMIVQTLEKMMMGIRSPMEWEFKALDQQAGLSFRSNFHFAVVGYLLKGLRSDAPPGVQSSTGRLLSFLLTVVARPTRREKYEVTMESLPYLLALLPLSEEVQRRCHLHQQTLQTLSMSGSSETITLNRGMQTLCFPVQGLSGFFKRVESFRQWWAAGLEGPSVEWQSGSGGGVGVVPMGAPLAVPDETPRDDDASSYSGASTAVVSPPTLQLSSNTDVPPPPSELLGGVGSLSTEAEGKPLSVAIPKRNQLRPSWRTESFDIDKEERQR